ALLVWAGLRPAEVRRLRWADVDLRERSITVRSACSKTGGVRQVDVCGALAASLAQYCRRFKPNDEAFICPADWPQKWRQIRDTAGFAGRWVQDVLRHTFASYHAKHYKDMALLQWNMGHRDQSLLRSRYVNMQGITRKAAAGFFN
ncbi:MAG: site-specific integrase, partial [Akkermansia sp.]